MCPDIWANPQVHPSDKPYPSSTSSVVPPKNLGPSGPERLSSSIWEGIQKSKLLDNFDFARPFRRHGDPT